MYYLHSMVRIKDLEESLDFYIKKLGLIEVNRRDDEKGRYTNIFLRAPSETASERKAPWLELTYNWPAENGDAEAYTGGRNFGHLAYAVENIYEYCAALIERGITINRPPRDGRMAFIKSPDGISIELLQIGDALAPAEPWLSMPNSGAW